MEHTNAASAARGVAYRSHSAPSPTALPSSRGGHTSNANGGPSPHSYSTTVAATALYCTEPQPAWHTSDDPGDGADLHAAEAEAHRRQWGGRDEEEAAAAASPYDPRYYTMTMPNLPPHRYTIANIGSRLPHMTYNISDIQTIVTTHRPPQTCADKFAIGLVRFVGWVMNGVTRFDTTTIGGMSKDKWVSRAVFLESVAAVPGMIAAMVRHLDSLRRLKRDHGWVRHLLEEADNERMHLFFFLREKDPTLFFRLCVWFTQIGFFAMNIVFYLVSPRTMHRFVGYLEEEAVKTYNCMVTEIDDPRGALHEWVTKPAPKDMAAYYCLGDEIHKKGSSDYGRFLEKMPEGLRPPSPAPPSVQKLGEATAGGSAPSQGVYYGPTYRDIILCIRADETGHREHNHMFADLHGSATERMIPREELEIVRFSRPPQPQPQPNDASSPHLRHGGQRHQMRKRGTAAAHRLADDGVTCVLQPINSTKEQQQQQQPCEEIVVSDTLRVPSAHSPSTILGGNNNVSPLLPSTAQPSNGGALPIPIAGPKAAKRHAKSQQHLFTASVSITDPFYLEV